MHQSVIRTWFESEIGEGVPTSVRVEAPDFDSSELDDLETGVVDAFATKNISPTRIRLVPQREA